MRRFDRRTFLKGLSLGAGAAVLGPIANQIEAFAEGTDAPLRVVIVMEGDCIRPRRVMPPETLAALDDVRSQQGNGPAEARWKSYTNETPLVTEGLSLPYALSPLAAYRDRMNIVFGLSNRIAGSGHTAEFGALSCSNGTRYVPGGETIDHYLGRRIGDDSLFRRLAVGVVDSPGRDIDYFGSASGPGRPMPVYVDPMTAFEAMFGAVSGESSRAKFDMRTELLDRLADDTRRLRSGLSSQEAYFLDEYLGSIELLAERQSKITSMEEALAAGKPELADTFTSTHPLVRLEAQCDLVAAALSVGLTRVAYVGSGCSHRRFSMRYTSLDPEIPGKHHFGHGGDFIGQDNEHWLTEIHHRHASCVARLIDRLQATPEGDGSVWDNTLVVYTSDGGDSHHGSFAGWPLVTISGKNVGLKTAQGGRSVIYPKLGSDNHRQLSNFYNTLCHVMGAPEDDFGREGNLRVAPGPLPELLT